jgi:curli production assembly/transport component CsgG
MKTKKNGNAASVPSLLPASIILEGGIVAYDSNTRTGGLGAKFLGIGLSTQYSVDQVTINLRAVNVMTGEVLNSVSTTKTIWSYEIHPSYFRFVNYYDLLEIEGGYTHNEPTQLAVKEAIDAAVMHLTVQGIKDKLWSLKRPTDWNDPVLQRYLNADRETTVTTVTPRQAAQPENGATTDSSNTQPS